MPHKKVETFSARAAAVRRPYLPERTEFLAAFSPNTLLRAAAEAANERRQSGNNHTDGMNFRIVSI